MATTVIEWRGDQVLLSHVTLWQIHPAIPSAASTQHQRLTEAKSA